MAKVSLHIELDDAEGSFSVNGPFHSLALCYSLLELARDVCKDEAQKLKLGIVQAHPNDVARLSGKGVTS